MGLEEIAARSGVPLEKYVALKKRFEGLREEEEEAIQQADKEAQRNVGSDVRPCLTRPYLPRLKCCQEGPSSLRKPRSLQKRSTSSRTMDSS
jgi:hypothetical protein